MRWVYILQCEDSYFYVGETSRLYRRFWEHQDGLGGLIIAKVINEIPNEKYENICKGSYERPEKYVEKNKTRKIKKLYK